jgi:hypothetical protein
VTTWGGRQHTATEAVIATTARIDQPCVDPTSDPGDDPGDPSGPGLAGPVSGPQVRPSDRPDSGAQSGVAVGGAGGGGPGNGGAERMVVKGAERMRAAGAYKEPTSVEDVPAASDYGGGFFMDVKCPGCSNM